MKEVLLHGSVNFNTNAFLLSIKKISQAVWFTLVRHEKRLNTLLSIKKVKFS
ncbi:MAG: hypothetical protein WCP85_27615 [Mariniphaga sp.]